MLSHYEGPIYPLGHGRGASTPLGRGRGGALTTGYSCPRFEPLGIRALTLALTRTLPLTRTLTLPLTRRTRRASDRGARPPRARLVRVRVRVRVRVMLRAASLFGAVITRLGAH